MVGSALGQLPAPLLLNSGSVSPPCLLGNLLASVPSPVREVGNLRSSILKLVIVVMLLCKHDKSEGQR